MTQASYYRRPLPDRQIAFSSPEGRALFAEALASGGMEGYFGLAEQFHTQAEPAFCGLGTLVVALNALGVDPGRLWKGPWRWYSEELLDCCAPLDLVRERGVTLDQLACLARCNGATVETRRPGAASLDQFREELRAACRAPGEPVVALGYSRRVLGQTGDGHFSPLAGYHEGRDLALVLDVARFKYPPHWVPLALLYEAMAPEDPASGKPRGWLVMRRSRVPPALYYRLSLARCSWPELSSRLFSALPRALSAARPRSAREAIGASLSALGGEACQAAGTVEEELRGGLDEAHLEQARALRAALRATPLFAEVAQAIEGASCCERGSSASRAELLTVMLLLAAPWLTRSLEGEARDELVALTSLAPLPPDLVSEIERLREQIAALHGEARAPGP